MPKSSKPPKRIAPDCPPSGTIDGTERCCIQPASNSVSENGNRRYFTTAYKPFVNGGRILNKCQNLDVKRTCTGGTVTITKTFSYKYANGATAKDHQSIITSAIDSAMGTWTSKAQSYKVIINEVGCAPQHLKIQFRAKTVTSGADVTVEARNIEGRSYVIGGKKMVFFIKDGYMEWVMIHEIGHTFGLPDEYIYSHPEDTAPSVTYLNPIPPDETITLSDSEVPAETKGTFSFDNSTVMGEHSNEEFPVYLYYWVGIEVRELLKKEGITACVQVV